MDLVAAVTKIAFAVNREINVDLYTATEFRNLLRHDNAFARNVLSNARIDLKGQIGAEAEAGAERGSSSKLPKEGVRPTTSGQAAG